MKLYDQNGYKEWKLKNTDPYGAAIFRYAEKWADSMEKEMIKGNSVKDVAKKASREADNEGITGFMYGAAVNILSKCWIHGEELRIWHNDVYGHTGDGIVNPAILNVNKQ